MLALTFSTGIVDAVGFLALNQVFTGNMTGNVAILAMALTGAGGLPVVGPLIALVVFILGAMIAGRVLRGLPTGWHPGSTVLFAVVATLLICAATVSVLVPQSDGRDYGIVAALGLAMGMQAGAARHLAVADITTIVVTATLVGVAFDSRLAHATPGHPWARRLSAILLLAAGVVTGALLQRLGIVWGIATSAAIVATVAVIGSVMRAPAIVGSPA